MTKSIITAAVLGIAVFGLSSCNRNGGFKTTKEGLQYKIIEGDGKNKQKAAVGDFVDAFIKVYIDDSLLWDSRDLKMNPEAAKPITIPIQELKYKFQPEAGFAMLAAGDSGVFRLAIDSLQRRGEKLPPWFKGRKNIEYRVKVVAVKTKQAMEQEQQSKASEQKKVDEAALQEYFQKNSIQPMKSAGGVYYTIETPGTGENVKAGQEVTVIYTGKLLDGTEFDSNDPKTHKDKQPFTVKVGQGMVIPGWDEGLQMFKKGSKGKLYIPSTLAYGQRGAGGSIPPNANLVFDVEIKDVK